MTDTLSQVMEILERKFRRHAESGAARRRSDPAMVLWKALTGALVA